MSPRRRPISGGAGNPSILVLTEGTKTEPDYLKHWQRRHRLTIAVEVKGLGVDPKTLVDRGVEELRRSKREQNRGGGDAYAAVWVVFDHDQHPGVRGQVNRASQAGLRVAFSNPCIELWFLLHFLDQTAHLDRQVAQVRCRDHLTPGKAIPDIDFAKLEAGYEQAKERAVALGQRHQGNGSWEHDNPSSTMWSLVDQIRESGGQPGA